MLRPLQKVLLCAWWESLSCGPCPLASYCFGISKHSPTMVRQDFLYHQHHLLLWIQVISELCFWDRGVVACHKIDMSGSVQLDISHLGWTLCWVRRVWDIPIPWDPWCRLISRCWCSWCWLLYRERPGNTPWLWKKIAVFGEVSENGVISKSWLSVLEWSDDLDDLGVPPFQETSKFYWQKVGQ